MCNNAFWTRLTSNEVNELQYRTNLIRITRGLHISEVERVIVGLLLVDQRRARVTTLGLLSGYARKTVRTTLERLRERLLVDHLENIGWQLTESGVRFYVMLYREVDLMARGLQQGFSVTLQDLLDGHG